MLKNTIREKASPGSGVKSTDIMYIFLLIFVLIAVGLSVTSFFVKSDESKLSSRIVEEGDLVIIDILQSEEIVTTKLTAQTIEGNPISNLGDTTINGNLTITGELTSTLTTNLDNRITVLEELPNDPDRTFDNVTVNELLKVKGSAIFQNNENSYEAFTINQALRSNGFSNGTYLGFNSEIDENGMVTRYTNGTSIVGGFIANDYDKMVFGTWGTTSAYDSTLSYTDLIANNTAFVVKNGHGSELDNLIGINTLTPQRRLEVVDGTGVAQNRLGYSSSIYTDLETDSSGNFSISPSGSSVTINSDLIVTGTTTFVGDTFEIDDPYLLIGSSNTGNSVDLGWHAKYVDGSTYYTGIFHDADEDGTLKIYDYLTSNPNLNVIDTTNSDARYAKFWSSELKVYDSNVTLNSPSNYTSIKTDTNGYTVFTASGERFGLGATPCNYLDISGATVIGSGYAGKSNAPTNGLLVEGETNLNDALTITTTSPQLTFCNGTSNVTFGINTEGDLTISPSGSTTTITSDLIVTGSTTFIGGSYSDDPYILLGASNAANLLDLGWHGKYVDGSTYYTGIFHDADEAGTLKIYDYLTASPTTNVVDTTNADARFAKMWSADLRVYESNVTLNSTSNYADISVNDFGHLHIKPTGTSIAIGSNAGSSNQGSSSVALGEKSGQLGQKDYAISIGNNAGQSNQRAYSIAMGAYSGYISQEANCVGIGSGTGYSNQGKEAVAIGWYAGSLGQQTRAVSLGTYAGLNYQKSNAIAVGYYAGSDYQQSNAIAIGYYAGKTNQSNNSIAIGYLSGRYYQGYASTALGFESAQYIQGNYAFASGFQAGNSNQGAHAIAIGYLAGSNAQGSNAIAIGNNAGISSQGANTIIINATGETLNTSNTDAFYVAPVRVQDTTSKMLIYNTTDKEVTYNTNIDVDSSGNITTTGTISSLSSLLIGSDPQLTLSNSASATANATVGVDTNGELTFTPSNSTVNIFDPLSTGEQGLQFFTVADDTNGGSARMFFKEDTNLDTFGFSLVYRGGSGTLNGSSLSHITANQFAILRHHNSATGAVALSLQRESGYMGVNTTSPGTVFTVNASNLSVPTYMESSDIIASFEDDTNTYIAVHGNAASADSGIRLGTNGTRYWSMYQDQNLLGFYKHVNTAGNVLTLSNNGYVGVNTSSPETPLDIQADGSLSGTVQLRVKGSTNINEQLLIGFDTSGNYGFIQPVEQGVAYRDLILNRDGGYVGVGTNTPQSLVHIRGEDQTTLIGTNSNALVIENSYIAAYNRFAELRFEIPVNVPNDQGTTLAGLSAEYVNVDITQGAGGKLHFYTKLHTDTHPSNRMTISDTGYVGINTTSPSSNLHVEGTSYFTGNMHTTGSFTINNSTGILMTRTGWNYITTTGTNDVLRLQASGTNGNVELATAGTVAMTIYNNQRVGIGSTSAVTRKLEVEDTSPQLRLTYSTGKYVDFNANSSCNLTVTANDFYFYSVKDPTDYIYHRLGSTTNPTTYYYVNGSAGFAQSISTTSSYMTTYLGGHTHTISNDSSYQITCGRSGLWTNRGFILEMGHSNPGAGLGVQMLSQFRSNGSTASVGSRMQTLFANGSILGGDISTDWYLSTMSNGTENYSIYVDGENAYTGLNNNTPSYPLHIKYDDNNAAEQVFLGITTTYGTANNIFEVGTHNNQGYLRLKDGSDVEQIILETDGSMSTFCNSLWVSRSGPGLIKIGDSDYYGNYYIQFRDSSAGVMAGYVGGTSFASHPGYLIQTGGGKSFNVSVDQNTSTFGNDETAIDFQVFYNGDVGVGRSAPLSKLHVEYSNAYSNYQAGVIIDQARAGDGDASLHWRLQSPAQFWSAGIDQSDSYKWKLSPDDHLNVNTVMTATTGGNVGFGTTTPSSTVHVNGKLTIGDASLDDHYALFRDSETTGVMTGFATNYPSTGQYTGLIQTGLSKHFAVVTNVNDTWNTDKDPDFFIDGSTGFSAFGTCNPLAPLHVSVGSTFAVGFSNKYGGNTGSIINFGLDTDLDILGTVGGFSGGFNVYANSRPMYIRTIGAYGMYLQTNSTTSTLIDSNGNVFVTPSGANERVLALGRSDFIENYSSHAAQDPYVLQIGEASSAIGGTSKIPTISLLHSRPGPGLHLGGINWVNSNSAGTEKRCAQIWAITGTTSNSGVIQFSTTSNSTFSEKMRIDEKGYVGIGTTTPGTKLDVAGQIQGEQIVIANTGSPNYLTSASYQLNIQTGGQDSMVISNSGNVNINGNQLTLQKSGENGYAYAATTNTISSFHTGVTGGGDIFMYSESSGYSVFGTATNHNLHLRTNNTDRLTIDTSGYVGIGKTTPDTSLDVYRAAANAGFSILVGDNGTTGSFTSLGQNQTSGFSPLFYGKMDTSAANFNATYLVSVIDTTLDVGTTPLMRFDAYLDNFSVVANRRLFQWRNYTTELMTMDKDGNLGILTSSPSSNLHVVGDGYFTGNLQVDGAITPGSLTATTIIDTSPQLTLSNSASATANATFGVSEYGDLNINPVESTTEEIALRYRGLKLNGGTFNTQIVTNQTTDSNFLIAKLPATSGGTWDHLVVSVCGGTFDGNYKTTFKAYFGNRTTHDNWYNIEGGRHLGTGNNNIQLIATSNADNSTNIYLKQNTQYTSMSYTIEHSVQCTVYQTPSNVGSDVTALSDYKSTLFDTLTATPQYHAFRGKFGINTNVDATSSNLTVNGTSYFTDQVHVYGTGSTAGGDSDVRITGTGIYGSGINLEATGTGGEKWLLYSSANSAGIGGACFGVYNTNIGQHFMFLDANGSNLGIGQQAGVSGQGDGSVAIGYYSGYSTQGVGGVALGYISAFSGQQDYATSIGYYAGAINQSQASVAIGYYAAHSNQGQDSVAIGKEAGWSNQGQDCIAIGNAAGKERQGTTAFAFGTRAGTSNQASHAVAIGNQAGQLNQRQRSIAVGNDAGGLTQGPYSIAMSIQAGYTTQGSNAVALGPYSGKTTQGDQAIAIGLRAGEISQGSNAIALGEYAGYSGQGNWAVAAGWHAGMYSQSSHSICLGVAAGSNSQGTHCVAIGTEAGTCNQGIQSVAIGLNAGIFKQSNYAVAIGAYAGSNSQGESSVAIGPYAGRIQNEYSVAMGYYSGNNTQDINSVAIGRQAGQTTQGQSSVAIGYFAGNSIQSSNAVAIGNNSGQNQQSQYSVAIGHSAAQFYQGTGSVAIGAVAGYDNAGNLGDYAVAVGWYSGSSNQGNSTVAVGRESGRYGQLLQATAVGTYAGNSNQGSYSFAGGNFAGHLNQGNYSTSLGHYSGYSNQGTASIAIGITTGFKTQGAYSVAIGNVAAYCNQSSFGVGIGHYAAYDNQGASAVAIGNSAGRIFQEPSAVGVGPSAGYFQQGDYGVGVGYYAARFNQGDNSVAIGREAGAYLGYIFITAGVNDGIAFSEDSGPTLTGTIAAGAYSDTGLIATAILNAINGAVGKTGTYVVTYETHDCLTFNVSGAVTTFDFIATANDCYTAFNITAGGGQATSQTTGAFSGQGANSVAVGYFAGLRGQGGSSVAVGASAGLENQGDLCVALGPSAGYCNQLGFAVAIGFVAGRNDQKASAVAVGPYCAYCNQNANAVAVGQVAGYSNQGTNAVAVGVDSGALDQGANSIAIGRRAAYIDQGPQSIAIGLWASESNQQANCIAIGSYSGRSNQGTGGIAMGYASGQSNQDWDSIAIGNYASLCNQGRESIAIGYRSGIINQGDYSVAFGDHAGASNQSDHSVAIGYWTGLSSQGLASVGVGEQCASIGQGNYSTAIGSYSGSNNQGDYCVAIGSQSGRDDQSNYSVAIGYIVATNNQGENSVAIGQYAGSNNQATGSVAIGLNAGRSNQGTLSYAIGQSAGYLNQGSNAVAIGQQAGYDTQKRYAVAVGDLAGYYRQSNYATATGRSAGCYNQGDQACAHGNYAGFSNQGNYSVAMGSAAGRTEQNQLAVAIGFNAAYSYQGYQAISIGYNSAFNYQGDDSIAMGLNSAFNYQSRYAVAIGRNAGYDYQGELSIAIGNYAANSNQSSNAIHIGNEAGRYGGNGNSWTVAIGYLSGYSNQGVNAVAIGRESGRYNQSDSTVAIGYAAGNSNQGLCASAYGYLSGFLNQGDYSVAIGYLSGYSNQGINAVAIGRESGRYNQSDSTVAIGYAAGNSNQGLGASAYGYFSGFLNQGDYSVAIGLSAGYSNQSVSATAVGRESGQYNQNDSAVAIGYVAGHSNQSAYAVAVGRGAGAYNQGGGAVSVGYNSGWSNQGTYCVAISQDAGKTNQGTYAVAIGNEAGWCNQLTYGVAIGYQTGWSNQGTLSVGVGGWAGYLNQGIYATAIGVSAGRENQSDSATAVGRDAGFYNQSTNAVAIGYNAGNSNQDNDSIAVGVNAGALEQGSSAIAIGPVAGWSNQGNSAVSMGYFAGYKAQSTYAVAIGQDAGHYQQSTRAIAIGYATGSNSQANDAIAIGYGAAFINQGEAAIAIGGNAAGWTTQGDHSIAIGKSAGRNFQETNSVAIGMETAYDQQGEASVAMGYKTGYYSQGDYAVAIGANCAQSNQQTNAIAIGPNAGQSNQMAGSIAIGGGSGATGQSNYSISIGWYTGNSNQGGWATAVGNQAGRYGQLPYATALGHYAGNSNQGTFAVAVGPQAAQNDQGAQSVAIGYISGQFNQGTSCVSIAYGTAVYGQARDSVGIGHGSAWSNQGEKSVAMGMYSGRMNQGSNAVGIGYYSGYSNQGFKTVAIGDQSAYSIQDDYAVAIGHLAGYSNQGSYAVSLGTLSARYNQGGNAISVGRFSGYLNQSSSGIAMGYYAAESNQAEGSIAIGVGAGNYSQGSYSTAVGQYAGWCNQGYTSAAFGDYAGYLNQGHECVAVGQATGYSNQGEGAIAMGDSAGYSNQGSWGVAIGYTAAYTTQGEEAIAIGDGAAYYNQGSYSVAIGYRAGQVEQSSNCIAIGTDACYSGPQHSNSIAIGNRASWSNQANYSISIGHRAAYINQDGWSVAIGNQCGESNQGLDSIAIGDWAGRLNQGDDAVALGAYAGQHNQQQRSVAVGENAGNSNQANSAIAIGYDAAQNDQGSYAVAVGTGAGESRQGPQAVGIGISAGWSNQRYNSIAIGEASGYKNQDSNAIAIGTFAGYCNQGSNAIAIGNQAGKFKQSNNTIILNATGSQLNASNASAFYVDPIRDQDAASYLLAYDSVKKEICYVPELDVNAAGVLSQIDLTARTIISGPAQLTLSNSSSSSTSNVSFSLDGDGSNLHMRFSNKTKSSFNYYGNAFGYNIRLTDSGSTSTGPIIGFGSEASPFAYAEMGAFGGAFNTYSYGRAMYMRTTGDYDMFLQTNSTTRVQIHGDGTGVDVTSDHLSVTPVSGSTSKCFIGVESGNAGYHNLTWDRHASTILGLNLACSNVTGSGTTTLITPQTHSTIAGTGIMFAGNNQAYSNSITFWTTPKTSTTAGDTFDQSAPRVIIQDNGDVGIGVADPDTKLEILNAGDQLKLSYDGTDNTILATDGNGYFTVTPSGSQASIFGSVTTPFSGAFGTPSLKSFQIVNETSTALDTNIPTLLLSHNQLGTSDKGVGIVTFTNSAIVASEKRLAQITALTDGATNAGKLAFATVNAASYSTQMVIDKNGKVGIGTIAPVNSKLHLYSNSSATNANSPWYSGASLLIENDNTTDNNLASLFFATDDSGGTSRAGGALTCQFTNHTTTVSADLVFGTTNANTYTEKMRLTSTGNLGINENNPGALLHIDQATAASTNDSLFVHNSSMAAGHYINMMLGHASSTNSNLIIGYTHHATDPHAWLCIAGDDGSGGAALCIKRGPKVGINTNAPSSNLHVNGDTLLEGTLKMKSTHNIVMDADTYPYIQLLRSTTSIGSFACANGAGQWYSGTAPDDVVLRSENSTNLFVGVYGNTTNAYFCANNSRLVTACSNGNVGITNTAPVYKLHLHEATTNPSYIHFTNTDTGATGADGLTVGVNGEGDGIMFHRCASNLRFGTSSAYRMIITDAGNVGIGNGISDASSNLHVNGDAYVQGGVQLENGGTQLNWYQQTTHNVRFTGIWASDIHVDLDITRIGNTVNIRIPSLSASATSASTFSNYTNCNLPANFRPKDNSIFSIPVYDNNALSNGTLYIDSSGNMTIQPTGANFTGSGNSGLQYDVNVSYITNSI